MKIQKKIITRELDFSIDFQSGNSKTHSVCDTYPNIIDDIIREAIEHMKLRFKSLETIIKHNEEVELEKRNL